MRFVFVPFLAAALFLAGCATENVKQEAFNRDLIDGYMSMNTLHALDAGKTNDVEKIEMARLEMAVGGLSYYGSKGAPDANVQNARVTLARQVLGYLSAHRKELDPKSEPLQDATRSLQQILTDPADVQRLKTLSDYLANIEQMRSVAPDRQVY